MASLSSKKKARNLVLLDRCIKTLDESVCQDLRRKSMGPSAPKRCRDKANALSTAERGRLEKMATTCGIGKILKTSTTRRACANLRGYALRFCPEAFPGANPDTTLQTVRDTAKKIESFRDSPMGKAYMLLSLVGSGAGAYHGYKRTQSVGWAIGWGMFGSLIPFVAIPVALYQGFGKKG